MADDTQGLGAPLDFDPFAPEAPEDDGTGLGAPLDFDPFGDDAPGRASAYAREFVRGAGEIAAGVPQGAALMSRDVAEGLAAGAEDAPARNIERQQNRIAALEEGRATAQAAGDAAMVARIDEQIAQAREWIATSQMAGAEAEPYEPGPVTETAAFKAGEAIRGALPQSIPQYQDELGAQVSQGFGSAAAFLLGGAATGGAGAAFLGSTSAAAGLYNEAKQSGASEEDARLAARMAGLIGTTEAIPVISWLQRRGGAGWKAFVKKVAFDAGEEAVQEGFQGTMQNLIAAGIYDPDRKTFENVPESMLVGAIVGGGIGAPMALRESREGQQERALREAAARGEAAPVGEADAAVPPPDAASAPEASPPGVSARFGTPPSPEVDARAHEDADDAAILLAAGYTVDDFVGMSPAERAESVEEARAAGVKPMIRAEAWSAIREAYAAAERSGLEPDDLSSPIPNDVIANGRATMDAAIEGRPLALPAPAINVPAEPGQVALDPQDRAPAAAARDPRRARDANIFTDDLTPPPARPEVANPGALTYRGTPEERAAQRRAAGRQTADDAEVLTPDRRPPLPSPTQGGTVFPPAEPGQVAQPAPPRRDDMEGMPPTARQPAAATPMPETAPQSGAPATTEGQNQAGGMGAPEPVSQASPPDAASAPRPDSQPAGGREGPATTDPTSPEAADWWQGLAPEDRAARLAAAGYEGKKPNPAWRLIKKAVRERILSGSAAAPRAEAEAPADTARQRNFDQGENDGESGKPYDRDHAQTQPGYAGGYARGAMVRDAKDRGRKAGFDGSSDTPPDAIRSSERARAAWREGYAHGQEARKQGWETPYAAAMPRTEAGGGATEDPQGAAPARRAKVVSPEGQEVDVEYRVVDAAALTPASGDLQPRDRSRKASDEQIAEIAAKLDPARLMPAREADRGAPIVGPDGIIESGNGRTQALIRAAQTNPEGFAAYVQALRDEGFDIPEGIAVPMVAGFRTTDLSPEARRKWVVGNNSSATARMSATEQAQVDEGAMTPAVMALYNASGDVGSGLNDRFVTAFMANLPQGERNALRDKDGRLNAEGRRRIQNAMFARAYGAPDLIARVAEGEADAAQSILNAMIRVAPKWAAYRAAVESGDVKPEFDLTANLVDALRIVTKAREDARAQGRPVSTVLTEALASGDIFAGNVDPATEAMVRAFYKGDSLRQAFGTDDLAALLANVIEEAQIAGSAAPSLFGEDGARARPREVVDAAKRRVQGAGGDLFAGSEDGGRAGDRGGAREDGGQPEERGRPADAPESDAAPQGGGRGGEVAPAKASDLNRAAGIAAYYNTSFSPEKRADADIQGYVDTVATLRDEMLALAKTDEQRAIAEAEVARYAEGYRRRLTALWAAKARTASPMITGPANFPSRTNRKRMDTADKRGSELVEWDKKARASIRKKVSEARPAEVKADDEWKAFRARMGSTLSTMEAIDDGTERGYDRALFAKNLQGRIETEARAGNVELVRKALDYIRERQAGRKKPLFTERNSIWGALERAEAARAQNVAAPTGSEIIAAYDIGEVSANYNADRVQIAFEGRPAPEVLSDLKGAGWKWSRAQGVWQRKMTPNARASAMQIMDRHGARTDEGSGATVTRERRARFAQAPVITPAMSRDLSRRLADLGLSDRVRLMIEQSFSTDALRMSQNAGEPEGVFGMNADGSDPFILVGASLDPTMTLDHEAVHALYNLGLFTPKEWAALSRRAKALWIKQHRVKERYPEGDEALWIEEAIAEEFSTWADGRRRNPAPETKTAFERIRGLLEALGNWLRGNGFQTVEDVFGKVEAGEVGARGAQPRDASGRFVERESRNDAKSDPFAALFTDADAGAYQTPDYDIYIESQGTDVDPVVYGIDPHVGRNQANLSMSQRPYEMLGMTREEILKASAQIKEGHPDLLTGSEESDDAVFRHYKAVADGIYLNSATRPQATRPKAVTRPDGAVDLGAMRDAMRDFNLLLKDGIDRGAEAEVISAMIRAFDGSNPYDDGFDEWFQGMMLDSGRPYSVFLDDQRHFAHWVTREAAIISAMDAATSGFSGARRSDRRGSRNRDVGDGRVIRERRAPPPPAGSGVEGFMDLRAINDGALPGLKRLIAKMREAPVDAGKKWLRDLDQAFLNNFSPIRALELRATGKTKLPVGMDSAFKSIEIAVNDSGRVETLLRHGAASYDENGAFAPAKGTKGLLPMLEQLGSGQAVIDWMHWMAARRAQALHAKGIKTPLSERDVKAGLAKETATFRKVAKDWKAFNDANLDFAVQSGLVAPKAAEAMKADETYIPFYRADPDSAEDVDPSIKGPVYSQARGVNNPKSGIKAIKGGERLKINNLVENMILNSKVMVAGSMRNMAANKVSDLVEMAGEGKVMNLSEAPDRSGLDQGFITFRREGKLVKLKPDDPAMVLALAGLRPQQLNSILQFMADVASFFRQGITLSPAFMIRNLWRGAVSTGVLTGKNLGLVNNTLTGLHQGMKNSASAQAFKARSGMGDFRFGGTDIGFGRNDVLIGLGVSHKTLGYRLRQLISAAEHVGTATELADRIALQENLIRQGVRPDEASYQALNIINYGRKGANPVLQTLLPLVPFLNARIQGLARLAESSSGERGLKNAILPIALRGSVLAAASAALWGWNNEDEEKRARYEAEPLWRRLNYHIVYDGERKYLIPKAFEIGALFGTVPEMMLEATVHGDTDELSPALTQTLVNTFSFNPLPAAILPMLEVAANYNFFTGREIEGMRLRNRQRMDRVDDRTSSASTAVADTWLASALGLSPMEVQHLIEGYGGVYANTLGGALDMVTADMGLTPKRPEGVFGSFPGSEVIENVLGSMVKPQDADPANKFVGDFYELGDAVSKIVLSAKDAARVGNVERAKALLDEFPMAPAAYKLVNRADRQMGELNTAIRTIRMDRKMGAPEKARRLLPLIQRRNALSAQVVKVLRDLEARQGARFKDE